MRTCPRCKQTLALSEFYGPFRTGKRSSYCKSCHNAITRANYLKNKTARVRRIGDQRRAARVGLTYEEYTALASDPGKECAVCGAKPGDRRNGMFRSGTVTDAKPKRLAIDHDHKSGRICGFLCGNCNRALGLMDDDPELIRQLAEYVEEATAAWEPLVGQKLGAKRREACPNGHPFTEENVYRFPSGSLTCGACRAERQARRESRACSVEGCTRAFYGLGFCRAHWRRFKRYGDPLAGRAENGSRRPRKQHTA